MTRAGAIAFGVLLTACGSGMAPTPALPTPASPASNAVISQNSPASGCAPLSGADATRGLGYVIPYRWSSSGGTAYELYVTNANAQTPALDTTVTTTSYTDTECNAFVTDGNLNGWQWRVRAKDSQGQFTQWSAWSTFQFAPCRLSDGTPCRLPD